MRSFLYVLLLPSILFSMSFALPHKVHPPQKINRGEGLYFIGWSKSGNAAYSTIRYVDAKATYDIDIIIQDMQSDSVLTYLSYEEPESWKPAMFQIMKKHAKTIKPALKKAGIVEDHVTFVTFPYTQRGATYTIEIEEECSQEEIYGFTFLKSQQIYFLKDGTKKLVCSRKNEGLCGTTDVIGFIPSPFEQRVALIITYTVPGYEGPPMETSYNLVGVHLQARF